MCIMVRDHGVLQVIIDGGGCATHCGGLESEGDGVVHHGQGPEGGQHVAGVLVVMPG